MDTVKRASTQPETEAVHVGRQRRLTAEDAPVCERQKEKDSDRKVIIVPSIFSKKRGGG